MIWRDFSFVVDDVLFRFRLELVERVVECGDHAALSRLALSGCALAEHELHWIADEARRRGTGAAELMRIGNPLLTSTEKKTP